MKKTILITGGAGFIGSHLCEKLLDEKYRIICLDNLITGSEKNISGFIGNKNFQFIKSDVADQSNSSPVQRLNGLSYIFHLASPASPVDYQNNPEETALANSLGTLNMLKLAVKFKAKFLFASTSEIYGDPLIHPQTEDYFGNVNTFGQRSCYDESKRFGETLTFIYINKFKLDARIIRIFNTYGPRMQKDDGRVVSNFINQCLNGKPITIYGNGEQTRSFCYVSDLVEGICKIMFSDGTMSEVFNLGNPEEHNMKTLAVKIKKMTGSKSKIVYKPIPADDPKKRRPDISKVKRVLRWAPKISLNIGLQKTIEYYKSIS